MWDNSVDFGSISNKTDCGTLPTIKDRFNSLTIQFETEFLGTGLLSFIIGIAFPYLANLFLDEEKFIAKAIDKNGSQLEKLFLKSFTENKNLALSLKSSKIYIGTVSKIPRQEYLRILPYYSGYRDENHGMIIDTQYLDVYDSIDQFESLSKDNLETIVNKSEITSARIHVDEVYDFMN